MVFASKKQVDYIECLMIDLEYFTSKDKKRVIRSIIGREVSSDAVTSIEASRIINELKEWKENNKRKVRSRMDNWCDR